MKLISVLCITLSISLYGYGIDAEEKAVTLQETAPNEPLIVEEKTEREDINRYINEMTITKKQKKSVHQLSKAIQETLHVDINNEMETKRVSQAVGNAVQCLSVNFPVVMTRLKIILAIETIVTNTKERMDKYLTFNKVMSAVKTKLPTGDTCSGSTKVNPQ